MSDLKQYAAEANRCHAAAEAAQLTWLESAIAAGEALNAARTMVEPGKWVEWVNENLTFSLSTSYNYTRAADFKDELRATGATTLAAFNLIWRGRHVRPGSPGKKRTSFKVTPELRSRIRSMRDSGSTWNEIADDLGYRRDTVRGWVDPEYARRARETNTERAKANRQRLREQKAAWQHQKDASLVKQVGGKTEVAYGLVRKAIQAANAAGLYEAEALLAKAEDAIVAALRKARTDAA